MPPPRLTFIVLGLSITSSWGNGHATTYRSLLRALAERGHDVLFLERDVPWYARHRDLHELPGVRVALYDSLADLRARFGARLRAADVVIVGSYVPEARELGRWLTARASGLVAFYDIDTPITLTGLDAGDDGCEYLTRDLLRRYGLYLSFTGGPALRRLERLGARRARPLYCGVDARLHRPLAVAPEWDLGYLGTYAADRQPALQALLLDVARRDDTRRFAVAGPLYPGDIAWPANVTRLEHLPPGAHSRFYCQQRFTLNLTRQDMRRLGYAPSVRLFEAAACGTAIISDEWDGLAEFFEPFVEILPAPNTHAVAGYLRDLPEAARRDIGARARERVLAVHTAAHRARTLEQYVCEALGIPSAATGQAAGVGATSSAAGASTAAASASGPALAAGSGPLSAEC